MIDHVGFSVMVFVGDVSLLFLFLFFLLFFRMFRLLLCLYGGCDAHVFEHVQMPIEIECDRFYAIEPLVFFIFQLSG